MKLPEFRSLPSDQEGRVGYILLWLLGVPIPILFLIYLLRGCTGPDVAVCRTAPTRLSAGSERRLPDDLQTRRRGATDHGLHRAARALSRAPTAGPEGP